MDINSLERFVQAQENTYETALNEIKNGKKETHWMWFIFPQLRGLGMSSISRYYGLEGIEEARAYLEHPVLSERLYNICDALLDHTDKPIRKIFGDIDAMKLKSSMTLFALAKESYSIYHEVLLCFFDYDFCPATEDLIKEQSLPL